MKILGNTLINGLDMVATLLFGFLLVPILLDRIGEDLFGVYTLLLVFSATGLLSFLDLGLEGALLKYLAGYEAVNDFNKYSKYFWNGAVMYFCIGLLLTVVFFTVINVFGVFPFNIPENIREYSKGLFNIYILQFPLQFLSLALKATLISVHKFRVLKAINFLFLLSNFLIIYFAVNQGNDLFQYVILFNTIYLVKCIIEYSVAIKIIPTKFRYKIKLDWSVIVHLFGYAKYLFVSKIVGLIYNQTDKLLISFMLPISNLAMFNILNKMPNTMGAVSSVLNSTIVPLTAKMNAKNETDNMKQLFLKGTKWSLVIMIPLIIICIFLIKTFLSIWVGPSYEYLAPLSIVLLCQYFFSQILSIGSTMIVGSGHVKRLIPYSVFGSVVNLIISISLLPQYGLLGLVIGTTVSYFLMSVPYLYNLLKIFDVSATELLNELIRPIGSFVLYTAICYVICMHFDVTSLFTLAFEVVLMLVIYIILGYLIVLSKDERENIMNVLNVNNAIHPN